MSELRINNITDTAGSSGPIIAGVSTVTSTSHMVMPSGPTEFRGGRGRGVVMGGRDHPTAYSRIDLVEIATAGNTTDFGDLAFAMSGGSGGASSSTRAFSIGGYNSDVGALTTTMQYIVISSSGGANEFGDLRNNNTANGAGSNNTRGLLYGGNNPIYLSSIVQFNLQSLGTESDFGTVFEGLAIRNVATATSPTRAIFGGGDQNAGQTSLIAFREIASGGTVFKFGELTYTANGHEKASSSTRGVFAGGKAAPTTVSNIDFITITSEGNGQDFGDLTQARRNIAGNSNSIRATFAAGTTASSGTGNNVNTIDFITIATTGNASDFGDLANVARASNICVSDSHGGIGD